MLSFGSKDPGALFSSVVVPESFTTLFPLFGSLFDVFSSLALHAGAVFLVGWRFFLAPLSFTFDSAKNRERDGRSGKSDVEGRGGGVVVRGGVSRKLSESLKDRGGVFTGVFGEEDKTMTSMVLVVATRDAFGPSKGVFWRPKLEEI